MLVSGRVSTSFRSVWLQSGLLSLISWWTWWTWCPYGCSKNFWYHGDHTVCDYWYWQLQFVPHSFLNHSHIRWDDLSPKNSSKSKSLEIPPDPKCQPMFGWWQLLGEHPKISPTYQMFLGRRSVPFEFRPIFRGYIKFPGCISSWISTSFFSSWREWTDSKPWHFPLDRPPQQGRVFRLRIWKSPRLYLMQSLGRSSARSWHIFDDGPFQLIHWSWRL